MSKYLDPEKDDPALLFMDMDVMDPPDNYDIAEAVALLCPRCRGHGSWNLQVNTYKNDIPAHRHFRASCGSCWGYGYLQKGQKCAHVWRGATSQETENVKLHRCEHVWVCEKCGDTRIVDSSD